MSQGVDIAAPAGRILIVDDAPDNRELLQIVLNWDGFVTMTAESGEEALASAAEQAPDLILLDLGLPGMGGCEVAVQMKGNIATKDIPIIVVSGRGDNVTRRNALSAGAADFITKPIDRSDLCQRVRNILRLGPAGS